jgi:hypothetical protein
LLTDHPSNGIFQVVASSAVQRYGCRYGTPRMAKSQELRRHERIKKAARDGRLHNHSRRE